MGMRGRVFLICVLAIAMLASVSILSTDGDAISAGASFTEDGVVYQKVAGDNTVEVYDLSFYFVETILEIPSTVQHASVDYTVVGIGFNAMGGSSLKKLVLPDTIQYIDNMAFYNNFDMELESLPESLTKIGNDAFYECRSITISSIPDSVTSLGSESFYNCDGIKELNIGSGITKLPSGCFYGCSGLTSISIPGTVKEVDGSFEGCENIAEVYIEDGVNSLDFSAFASLPRLTSVSIPDSVTYLGSAFENCTGLMSVRISESVTEMRGTFKGCTSLTSVNIPDSVKKMDRTFEGCTSLGSFNIGPNVSSLGYNTFSGTPIKELTIPSSVRSIGGAFNDCTQLVSVVFEEGISEINYGFSGCTMLEHIEIPKGVYSIGSAFTGCTSLETISLPDSIHELNGTFEGCTSLSSVNFKSITNVKIGDNTFKGCESLEDFDLSQVNEIGSEAFLGCTSLESIDLSIALRSIGNEAFEGCTSLRWVTIPHNSTYADVTLGDRVFADCWNMESAYVGVNVKSVGDQAFADCAALTRLMFLCTGEVGEEVFDGCSEIAYAVIHSPEILSQIRLSYSTDTLAIGGTVEHISENLFSQLSNLRVLIIEEGVVSVDNYAFRNSHDLELVAIPDSLSSVGHIAFDIRNPGCKVAGPDGCLDNYSNVDLRYTNLIVYSIYDYPKGADFVYYQGMDRGSSYTPVVEDIPGYSTNLGQAVLVMPDEDEELNVRYYPRTYSIMFTYNSETYAKYNLSYGEQIPLPDVVPFRGPEYDFTFIFSGWEGYTEGMLVTDDVVFEAEFTRTLSGMDQAVIRDNRLNVFEYVKESVLLTPDMASQILDRLSSEGISQAWFGFIRGGIILDSEDLSIISGKGIEMYVGSDDGQNIVFEGSDGSIKAEVVVEFKVLHGSVAEVRQISTNGSYTVVPSTYDGSNVHFEVVESGKFTIVSQNAPLDNLIIIVVTVAFILAVLVFAYFRYSFRKDE